MSWTHVQGTGNTSVSGSGSISAAYQFNVTQGNLLVAAICNNNTIASGVTDTLGNTWTRLVQGGATSANIELWYAISIGGGANTVTAGNQTFSAIAISEFSPSGTITVTGTALVATGATGSALASGNLTITTPALVIGAGTQTGTGVTFTPGSGFTMDYTITRATHVGIGLEYALAVGSSPSNPAMTASLSVSPWAMGAAAFLSTASANGSTNWPGISVHKPHQRAPLSGPQLDLLYG